MSQRSLLKIVLSSALVLAVAAYAAAQTASSPALKNPAGLKEPAPAKYTVNFDTSAGAFKVEVTRSWAPNGADRFYNLVKNGYYDGCRFFRVVSGFMVQFGINGDPAVNQAWQPARIQDDSTKESNMRGYITFANAGPNTRTTQVFINFKDNNFLDQQPGFAPFGKVTVGMDVVDKLYAEYGEGAPSGKGPNQGLIQSQGNAYLEKSFPKLDYIKKATIDEAAGAGAKKK
jgi:peptidyl-prolyl cis-trans isomerase A (cyclophilin A)